MYFHRGGPFLMPYPFTFIGCIVIPFALISRAGGTERPGIREFDKHVFAGFCMKINMGFQIECFLR